MAIFALCASAQGASPTKQEIAERCSTLQNNINLLRNKLVDIKKAEQNRQRKIEQKDDLNDSLDEKKKQLNDIIIQQTPKIFAHDAFKKSLELIEENKDESYIYPIDASILEDSITDHSCKVCDRAIDEKLIEILNNKKAKLYLISPENPP